MDSIRIGVIGTGNMGKNHLRIIRENPAFELVGLFDTDNGNARKTAEFYNVPAFDDIDSLLGAADAVSIAAPSYCHREIAIAAAKSKRHMLLEKPIALNVPDAERIIEACGEAGVTLMVGHVERYNPVFTELAKVLTRERIFAVIFHRLSPFDSRAAETSVVFDLMIHDVDLLCALVEAPVRHIASHGACVYSVKPDYVQALVSFENGVLADLTASRITESKVRCAEVMAQNAYIRADFLSRSVDIMRRARLTPDAERSMGYRQENIVERVYVPLGEPLRAEFSHFAECVMSGQKPRTDGYSALKALCICEQITEELEYRGDS